MGSSGWRGPGRGGRRASALVEAAARNGVGAGVGGDRRTTVNGVSPVGDGGDLQVDLGGGEVAVDRGGDAAGVGARRMAMVTGARSPWP